MADFYAPQVDQYVQFLGRHNHMAFDSNAVYDGETYRLLDILFQKLEQIEQRPEQDGVWELWLQAERGPIEAFGNYQEMLDDGEVASHKEYEERWKESYPVERYWYHFMAVSRPDSSCRWVCLCHRRVIGQGGSIPVGFPLDAHEFAQWLLDSVEECIAKLRAGTYNEEVREKLPPQHRTGYLLQRDLWRVFPDTKQELLGSFTPAELETFFDLVRAQEQDGGKPRKRLSKMTAGDFFRFCAMGYAANQYEGQHLTPKEQYLKQADGRDEGLRDLPEDDPDAFADWLGNRPGGGHPWEICRGGNSTHIDLFPRRDASGYYLELAGSSWGRTVETVKIYLALNQAGVPIILREAKALGDRLRGEEKVGIVPEGVFPRYCHSYFPDEHIIDFINLPFEGREKLAKLCVWQPIPEIHLVAEGSGHGA